jgi:hypothetical protein
VICHLPEEIWAPLLPGIIDSGASNDRRLHVALGPGERLSKLVGPFSQTGHITVRTAGDHVAPDGQRVVAAAPCHKPLTQLVANANVRGQISLSREQREDLAGPTLDEPRVLELVGVKVNVNGAHAAQEARSAVVQAPPPRQPVARSPHSPQGGSAARRGPNTR